MNEFIVEIQKIDNGWVVSIDYEQLHNDFTSGTTYCKTLKEVIEKILSDKEKYDKYHDWEIEK